MAARVVDRIVGVVLYIVMHESGIEPGVCVCLDSTSMHMFNNGIFFLSYYLKMYVSG